MENGDGDNLIKGVGDIASLYFGGSEKMATTNTGIDITGNVVVSGTVDGRDVAADGTTLDAIAVTSSSVTDGTTTFNKYVHPTTSGNKHIPAGGSALDILTYSSDGTAVWAEPAASGHDIVDESGSALATQDTLTFKGELVEATDNGGTSSTDVTINAKTSWLYG